MLRRYAKKQSDNKSEVSETKSKKNSFRFILEKLEENAEISRFSRSCDDSSDEEDDYSGYDINKSWIKTRPKAKSKSRNTLTDDKLLSFSVHYAAHELLCSERVNSQYYPLKKELLNPRGEDQDSVKQLYEGVKLAVQAAIDDAIVLIERFLSLTKQKELTNEKLASISKRVKTMFVETIDEFIISKLDAFIQWIKINRALDQDESGDNLNEFEEELTRLFVKEFMRYFTFETTNHDRRKVRNTLLSLAKNKVDEITSDFGFDKKAYNDGKKEALYLLSEYTGPYPHLITTVKSILETCPARGLVIKLIANKLAYKKPAESLTKAFIEDLIEIKNKEINDNINAKKAKSKQRGSKTKQGQLSLEEQDAFSEYFNYNGESLRDELTSHFQAYLHRHLTKQLRSFHRPVLDNDYLFSSHDAYGLISNIRLLNRSQTRKRWNLQHSIFKEDIVARHWRLVEPHIPGTDVPEIQKILKSSFGRMDMVLGLGNYENVYTYIQDIKAYFHDNHASIMDKDIAEWIRSILKGTPPTLNIDSDASVEVMRKLQAITYLIFGCEVARNPAMMIINQMLLDLIIENPKWSFEEAFTGRRNNKERHIHVRRMPMAPEGAVAAARALENEYQENMPYAYSYHGICDETGVSAMVRQEANIMRAWIVLKEEIPDKLSQHHIAEWILNLIKDQYETWFGASPDVPLSPNTIKMRR